MSCYDNAVCHEVSVLVEEYWILNIKGKYLVFEVAEKINPRIKLKRRQEFLKSISRRAIIAYYG